MRLHLLIVSVVLASAQNVTAQHRLDLTQYPSEIRSLNSVTSARASGIEGRGRPTLPLLIHLDAMDRVDFGVAGAGCIRGHVTEPRNIGDHDSLVD